MPDSIWLVEALATARAESPDLAKRIAAQPLIATKLAQTIHAALGRFSRLMPGGSGRWAVMAMHKTLLALAPESSRHELTRVLVQRAPDDEAIAAALTAVLAADRAAHPESGLALHLAADANPDFPAESRNGSLHIAGTWRPVSTLRSAQKAALAFISGNSLGSGNYTGGAVRHRGRRWARVAYNGRIFLDAGPGQIGRELAVASLPGREVFVER